jgi:hypothetical protein
MADIIFNIAKGRGVEFYNRVKSNDPANSALIAIPIETTGLETDGVLKDKADLAAVLAGTTNEQTAMGRKVLTDADLAAFPAPDNVNDRYDVSLPLTTWVGATGNAVSKVLICYDSDTTGGTDANIIPISLHDWPQAPSGVDLSFTPSVFFRAA